jgi:hypothetical protein
VGAAHRHFGECGRGGEIKQQYEAALRSLRDVGGSLGLRCVPGAEATEAPRASIVVLPFANLSDDSEQQYFADGITGNLTTDMSRIPDMLVISHNTAFTYRNKPIDTKQIGRELGVRYVLEGDVQRSGSQVRVTAELIDAKPSAMPGRKTKHPSSSTRTTSFRDHTPRRYALRCTATLGGDYP